jgi:O-antigen ligase
MFNMFAITALLEVVFRRNTPLLKQLSVLSLLVFLLVIQLQLQSRIVIVTTFMSMFFLFIFHWKSSKKWLVLGLLVFSGLLMQVPAFQGRFQTVASESLSIPKMKKTDTLPDDPDFVPYACQSSTSLRYYALLTSYEIIRKHPLVGVGTGDWRDELVKGYTENKRICNVKEETAPHNQYVRTILKHGVLGFLVLAVYFIFLGKTAIQKRELAQLSYLFCLIFCALGYDLMDGGGTAPFVAFFASLLFLARSEETHITSLSSHSV